MEHGAVERAQWLQHACVLELDEADVTRDVRRVAREQGERRPRLETFERRDAERERTLHLRVINVRRETLVQRERTLHLRVINVRRETLVKRERTLHLRVINVRRETLVKRERFLGLLVRGVKIGTLASSA